MRVEPSGRAWCPRQRDPIVQSAPMLRGHGRPRPQTGKRPSLTPSPQSLDADWTSSLQDWEETPPGLRTLLQQPRRRRRQSDRPRYCLSETDLKGCPHVTLGMDPTTRGASRDCDARRAAGCAPSLASPPPSARQPCARCATVASLTGFYGGATCAHP